MRQIITHLTDNDAYTFSVQYYILQQYPRAEVRYNFFDRNNRKYPKGFGELLQEQIYGMANVILTDEEYQFMKESFYYLPEWYLVFLKGYRFNPSEVHIFQDLEGYLSIMIEGKWYSTIMWEMPILSTISELLHELNGDMEKVDPTLEYKKAYEKGIKAFRNGLKLSDMGTRRRFSFNNQENVLRALVEASHDTVYGSEPQTGSLVGTSNVWFAKEFGIKPIGTMSHQIISFEECVSGVFEANYKVMERWNKVYDGDLGIYLYDCFGDKVFFNNLSKSMAKLFDGLRVDSGNEEEQVEKIMAKYEYFGINPKTKSVVFSNALNIDKAIKLHKYVAGRMQDSYGIGTHLMADVTNQENGETFPYSNIVIKLTGMRITERREWHDCVKLSCDKGKTLGNKEKCDYLLRVIG